MFSKESLIAILLIGGVIFMVASRTRFTRVEEEYAQRSSA